MPHKSTGGHIKVPVGLYGRPDFEDRATSGLSICAASCGLQGRLGASGINGPIRRATTFAVLLNPFTNSRFYEPHDTQK